MEPFRSHSGRAIPLDRADVDTDQIIPKQFLKRIERTGWGPFLFHDWRKDPDFVLNRPERRGATVLIAGPNFGCGSSREHAPWALQEHGFKAVIAPSFGDIFKNNCSKIGLVAVQLPAASVRQLMDMVGEDATLEVTVDLERNLVSAPGFEAGFAFDPFTRECLLNGWDDVALTLRHDGAIARYEASRPGWLPKIEVPSRPERAV